MTGPDVELDPEVRFFDVAIRRAEAAAAEIDAELRGLRLARGRRLRDLADTGPRFETRVDAVPAPDEEWRRLPRTVAIERMLRESGGALHRKVLTQKLAAVGRSDPLEHVSAALSYLERERRVTPLGQGWWRIGPAHEPMADHLDIPTPVGLTGPLGESGVPPPA